jgi:hypothetical protein
MTPETNGAAAAKVSAAIPACAFKGMSDTIFLHRLWKIPQLTTSFRQPTINVNNFWGTQATIFGRNPPILNGTDIQLLLFGRPRPRFWTPG